MVQRRKDVREVAPGLRVTAWEFERARESLGEPENPWWSVLVVEQDLDGALAGWKAEAEFRMEGTGVVSGPNNAPPRIVEIRFRPDRPAEWNELPTQRALRAIRLGDVLREIREWLAFVPHEQSARVWIDAIDRGKRSGRRGKQDRYYAIWAERRVEAQAVAPKAPIKWLVERYGNGESEGAVNMVVHRARNRGFLEGRPPRLTAKAEAILREMGQEGVDQ